MLSNYYTFLSCLRHFLSLMIIWQQFQMSQIKSYLSLESVPSLQFKTPPKNIIQNIPTNHSMSFSNTVGSADNKSSWNRRTFYNSQDLFKQPNYQSRDFVEERSEQLENNSSAVTLQPAITPNDILEIVNAVKMIVFLEQRNESGRMLIDNKEKAIKALKSKIYLMEEGVKFIKKQFEKKQKIIKSRSLSIQKLKQAQRKNIHSQLFDMKLEINQMKRTLSAKKATIQSRRNSNQKQRPSAHAGTDRKPRQKIYVPIYSNRFFAAPHQPYDQMHHYQHSGHQSARAFPNPEVNYINTREFVHQATPVGAHSSAAQSNKASSKNSGSKRYCDSIPHPSSHKRHPSNNELNGNYVLNLIQQKLKMPSYPILSSAEKTHRSSQNHSLHASSKRSPQIAIQNQPATLFQMLAPSLQKQLNSFQQQNYNIQVHKEHQKQPNLDYFDDTFQKELDLADEMLLQSHQSRKSIKALKKSSMGHTNKWKKDAEDEQVVEMIKQSLQNSQNKANSNKQPQIRTELGAKLVQTNIKEESFDVHIPEKSREMASSPLIANNSNVEIFMMDNTDERSKNQSIASDKRNSVKSVERQNIVNSAIGIVINGLQDDSAEDLELNIQSKVRSPKKNELSLQKAIEKIDEASDEGLSRGNTPVTPVPADFKFISNMEPSVESGYMETPRETYRDPHHMTNSNNSNISKQETPQSPPLTRPPSLIEQQEEEDDDIIDSIKLATSSKYSIKQPSKINRLSESIQMPEQKIQQQNHPSVHIHEHEEEDDILGGIKLNGMSKISREKASVNHSGVKDLESIPQVPVHDKMAQSQLSPFSNYNGDSEGMDIIDFELRRSTNSVIVKKGTSAIQRSGARKDPPSSNSKSSSRSSSLLGKSANISAPIEQAEEEEEEYSAIVKKHKRHTTDLIK